VSDPFAQDAQRRKALSDELAQLRVALRRAVDEQDAPTALAASTRALDLLGEISSSAVFCTGDHEDIECVGVVLRPSARSMVSRYNGFCVECDSPYSVGQPIWWDPKTRTVTCVRCGGLPGGL
jgi:hypothetical protein